ncbi:MAG: amine dehydrogenase large subunit [Pseudohongiellaceae bacterium]
MRLLSTLALGLTFLSPLAFGQLTREQITVETLPEPGSNWFVSKSGSGARLFDAESGQMLGMLSLSDWTPAVTLWHPREEFYAAESYFSRGVHGERTDMVTVYDYDNLSPIAEIIIPNHMARLAVRGHIAMLNNGRHLVVHNMNPGHSVSIVDVQDRVFVYELMTPGCAVNMAVAQNDFLQLCGDGTLQLIQLDLSGYEQNRARSDVFFDVQEDAVFDRIASTADGWLLVTHGGELFEVNVSGVDINVGAGWQIPADDAEGWRPGGRGEFLSVHHDTGLLYIAMHEGGVDTHHERGTEIWVVDLNTQRLLKRLEMEEPVGTLLVTQEANPKLIVGSFGDLGILVFDALSFQLERSIEAPGAQMFEDF